MSTGRAQVLTKLRVGQIGPGAGINQERQTAQEQAERETVGMGVGVARRSAPVAALEP